MIEELIPCDGRPGDGRPGDGTPDDRMHDFQVHEASYTLTLIAGRYAVCRLPALTELPDWVHPEYLLSITWRAGETSIVCPERYVPPEVKAERGWRALEVSGPLDFILVGVLSSLLQPLAQAQVSVFVLSTFDTDLILIPEVQLERALSTLREAGHLVK